MTTDRTYRPPFLLVILALIVGLLAVSVAASYAATARRTQLGDPGYVCTHKPKLCALGRLNRPLPITVTPIRNSNRSRIVIAGSGYYVFSKKTSLSASDVLRRAQPLLDHHAVTVIIDGRDYPTHVSAITNVHSVGGYLHADFSLSPVSTTLKPGLHTVKLQMVDDEGNPLTSLVGAFGFSTVHLTK